MQKRVIKIKDSKNPNRKKQGYGKDRIIPLPEVAVSPIKKWLSIIEGSKYFLSAMNSPDKPMQTKTLHEWFRVTRERANLNHIDYSVKRKNQPDMNIYKFRFHHLRHFYAQYVYDKTRDLYAVAGLLGHNQVTTTQVYAKVSDRIKKESVDFAFNTPMKTQIFEDNPINALNYNVPNIAKKEKTPVEVLEERFARGEISAVDFQTALRLLKARKDYLNDDKQTTEHGREAELN